MTISVKWIDRGLEPQQAPNPAYPDGIDLRLPADGTPRCTVPLPYPARRIGYYSLLCDVCGLSFTCTTAGRPDDPRSVELPCKLGRA